MANWPLRCVHTRLALTIKAQHIHKETNAPFESSGSAGCFASQVERAALCRCGYLSLDRRRKFSGNEYFRRFGMRLLSGSLQLILISVFSPIFKSQLINANKNFT
jgi:hypothetical protein